MTEISKIKIDDNNLIIKDAIARNNIESLSTDINDNYLRLTGGTVNGNINLNNANLWFRKNNENKSQIYVNNSNQLSIRNTAISSSSEFFYTPIPDSRTTEAFYNILTTKNPVTIAQGGTSATTAALARSKLSVLGLEGGTLTGNLYIKQSNWDITSGTIPSNYYSGIFLSDSSGKYLAWMEGGQFIDGHVRNQIGTRKVINNSNVDCSLSFEINNNGLKTIKTGSSLILTNSQDANGTALSDSNYPPLIIGSTNSGHIEFDTNEIMAKSDEVTPSKLYLNYNGGNIYFGNKTYIDNIYGEKGKIQQAIWNGDTIGVDYGGTGAKTFTAGAALIGNGTGAITTRNITNNTSVTHIAYNTNLMTTNTLAYWNGAYGSGGSSNLTKLGTVDKGIWHGSTIGIAYGGTGATSRTTAVKSLFNQKVSTSTQYFLTFNSGWEKCGYSSVADAWEILGGNNISASKITAGTLSAERLPSFSNMQNKLLCQRFTMTASATQKVTIATGIGIIFWDRANTYGAALLSQYNATINKLFASGTSDPTLTYDTSTKILTIKNNRESNLTVCVFGATIGT